MTLKKLHSIVSELIKQGHGRKLVCIDKRSFQHPLEEDGAVILPVSKCEIDSHEMLDYDGGYKELANGQTAYRTAFVISGDSTD